MPPHRYAVLRAEQQLPNVVRIGVTNDIRQRMPEGQAPMACGAFDTMCMGNYTPFSRRSKSGRNVTL